MTLTGNEPRLEDYAAMRAATTDQARESLIQLAIEGGLSSPRFYDQMVSFAHDYLRDGPYIPGTVGESSWSGGMGIELSPCPAGTRHANKLGIFRSVAVDNLPADPDGVVRYGGTPIDDLGDSVSLCNTVSPQTNAVEPWWAPGTTVTTIGRAGTGVVTSGGKDCGRGQAIFVDFAPLDGHMHVYTQQSGCSCGPNLLYCALAPRYDAPPLPFEYQPAEGRNTMANGQRRSAFEEPARLFAHIVTNDRPFSDLILGDYTVVNQKLQHMYVRLARMTPENQAMDSWPWWRDISDPIAWREVPFAQLHRNLLADRNYQFDPRTQPGVPAGIPSAGVLTTLGKLAHFARERVSAARWLQILACYKFVAPPASQSFPPLGRDPSTTGQCSHCHAVIDPAAIFFKRFGFYTDTGELVFGGVGSIWRWPGALPDPFERWDNSYIHSTTLTPVSESDIARFPDARFIDFLPPQFTLLGRAGEPTIGPLGFAKIVVQSGEFDRCAVQQLHERFAGRALDLTTEGDLLNTLVAKFLENQRKVKPFIRYLLAQDSFRRGL